MNIPGARPSTARHMVVCALCVSLLTGGCTAKKLMKGDDGVDTTSVRAGTDRAEIEKLIGKPLRQWQSFLGVTFCLYEFAGPSGSTADGVTYLVFDVMSLGLFELFPLLNPKLDPKPVQTKMRRVVSYDREGRVLGVFNEKDALPPDGKPPGLPLKGNTTAS
jgi:hypothetical protein